VFPRVEANLLSQYCGRFDVQARVHARLSTARILRRPLMSVDAPCWAQLSWGGHWAIARPGRDHGRVPGTEALPGLMAW